MQHINYLNIEFGKLSFCYMPVKYGDEVFFCWYDSVIGAYYTRLM